MSYGFSKLFIWCTVFTRVVVVKAASFTILLEAQENVSLGRKLGKCVFLVQTNVHWYTIHIVY